MTYRNAALDLLNSAYLAEPGRLVDELDDDDWVSSFLARWSLPRHGIGRGRSRLRELRDALRWVTDDVAARLAVSDEALGRLHAWLPPETTRWVLRRDAAGGVAAEREPRTRRAATVDIALAFVGILGQDGPMRLKVCRNADCVLAFYDESRNRSRRWCAAADCGNVMKVRAFRRRQVASRDAT